MALSGMLRLKPFQAFNIIKAESVLMLDCCSTAAPVSIPGVVSVNPMVMPMAAAILAARQEAEDNFCPDDLSVALLLDDSGDIGNGALTNCSRAEEAAVALLSEGGCKRVLCVGRHLLWERFGFLFGEDGEDAPAYPSEIVEGSIFLGSVLAAEQKRLDKLVITHVVTVLDRRLQAPARQEYLDLDIMDDSSEDLAPVMERALPFIADAVKSGGRILVHCEQGRSRSASVVIAHLMRERGMNASEALAFVKAQRPSAEPNSGFMAQLQMASWESALGPPHKRLACESGRCT